MLKVVEIRALATAADRAACRRLIRHGSRSFHAASLLLPKRLRDGAYALYGFCRLSDDAVDLGEGEARAVDRLRARLDAIYAGWPMDHAVDRCLADTVRRFSVPRGAFDALLEGFEWDLEGRRYETLADVEAYGERVAGSVGAMMAALMDVRDPAMAERACDLGVAMQLTNIARDVGEDAANGRLYLPRDWFAGAGLDADAWLAAPTFTPEIAGFVRRLLERADALYARADEAIARLPPGVRPAIYAARMIYAGIGVQIARLGYDSVSARARTGLKEKLALTASALSKAARNAPGEALDIADGADRALVAAVMAAPAPQALAPARSALAEDVHWMLDLIEALERRDRHDRFAPAE